jgi:hypothetical protein
MAGKVTLPLDQVEARWRWWNARPRTDAWAARYGGQFGRVEQLFADSLAALEADRAQKVSAEKRERELLESQAKLDRMRADEATARARRTRVAALAFLIFGILAFASAAYGFIESRRVGEANVALRNQQTKLEAETRTAQTMSSAASEAKNVALNQSRLAQQQKQVALEQKALAVQQKQQADEQRSAALKEKELADLKTQEADRQRNEAENQRRQVVQSEAKRQVLGVKREALSLAYQSSQRTAAGNDVALAALEAGSLDPTASIHSALLTPLSSYSGLRRTRVPSWTHAALAGDGKSMILVTAPPGGSDPRTKALVLDARRMSILATIPSFPSGPLCGFSDSQRFAASDGTTLSIYDVSDAKPRVVASRALGHIGALACLEYPDAVAVAGHDLFVRTYVVSGSELVEKPPAHRVDQPAAALVASSKGSWLAALPATGSLFYLIDTAGTRGTIPVRAGNSLSDIVRCVRTACAASLAFSPDEQRVAWCDVTPAKLPAAPASPNPATPASLKSNLIVADLSDVAKPSSKAIPACPPGSVVELANSGYPQVLTSRNVYNYSDSGGYQATFANSWGYYTGAEDPPPTPQPPDPPQVKTPDWDLRNPGPPNPLYDIDLQALITPEIDIDNGEGVGGVALRSTQDESAPLLGRQGSPSFRGCVASYADKVYFPGTSRPVEYNLDQYRTQFDRYALEATHSCLFDAGGFAAFLDFDKAKFQIWKFGPHGPQLVPRTLTFHAPKLNTDAKGNYSYSDYPRAAYDPATGVVSLLDETGLTRFAANGSKTFVPVKNLWERSKPPNAKSVRYELSPRGHYVYYMYIENSTAKFLVLTADGKPVGTFVAGVPSFAIDDSKIVARKLGDRNVGLYDLPGLHGHDGVLLEGASPAGISPSGDELAYVDHDLRSIDLYDLRLGAFAGHLVRPPATDRFDQPFIDLHYSGDGRFLIVQYRVDNEGSWGDAIYSVDPKEWEEALCLRIGRPMSARELKAFHADSKNPCRRYTAEMGH